MALQQPAIYGLIGFPLGHSFSQDFFNQKFITEGINAQYINFEITAIEDFKSIISRFPNLAGLNVTIPYKEKVMPYLDALDEEASQIGAVNVIKIERNSKGAIASLKGYNSDVIGFVDSIRALIKPYHKKALVLGTGGASKAVCYGLSKLGIEPTLVSRSKANNCLTYSELTPLIMQEHKVIVNTTPLGMFPNTDTCPDIPYQLLTDQHLCYDLIYNPDITLFMKKSSAQGAVTKNGLEMLLMQAFAAWNIWQAKK